MRKLILIFILLMSSFVHAGEYASAITDNAIKYDYVRELTNKNDGPEIEKWQKNVGLSKGNPYCQAFVYSMCLETQPEVPGTMLMKTGRVAYNWQYVKKNPLKFKIITLNQVRLGIYKLQKGDLIIWSSSADGINDFNGHIGIIISQISSEFIKTIEANTQPSMAGNQREGGGVYYRQRMLKSYWNFKIVGFIRIIK